MTKYSTEKYWCFAWSNGTPRPFIIPEVGASRRADAKQAALDWFNGALTWRQLYAAGGRVVHCVATPIQRKPRA